MIVANRLSLQKCQNSIMQSENAGQGVLEPGEPQGPVAKLYMIELQVTPECHRSILVLLHIPAMSENGLRPEFGVLQPAPRGVGPDGGSEK